VIEENIKLAEYRQEILDQEQQIIDLEQKVEHMTAERDWFVRLDDKMFTQAEVDKKVDEERKRSWNENKAFQWDLAEQNAEMRKQLGEKHDDNCRLQRSLAEEHNKLMDAYKELEDLEMNYAQDLQTKKRAEEYEASDHALVKVSNAERANDDLHAQLERLTSMTETLWEERRVGVRSPIKMNDDPDYFFLEIDDTGGTGLVYKIETDQEAVRFTASNGNYHEYIELPLGITYDLLAELHDNSRF